MNNEQAEITYLSVRISHDGIAEIDHTSVAVFVPKRDIIAAELMHAIEAERPIFQGVMGLIFTALGIAGIVAFLNWLAFGGILYDVHILLLLNLIVGTW